MDLDEEEYEATRRLYTKKQVTNKSFDGFIKQNKIQEYRTKKNMSQQKLAELMKVKQNTISQWERGERAPTLNKAIKLADILETTVESLYK